MNKKVKKFNVSCFDFVFPQANSLIVVLRDIFMITITYYLCVSDSRLLVNKLVKLNARNYKLFNRGSTVDINRADFQYYMIYSCCSYINCFIPTTKKFCCI